MTQRTIVLAMHGMPPTDFPRDERGELVTLEMKVNRNEATDTQRIRFNAIDSRMRQWPRTPKNDPYHAASWELAGKLATETRLEVIVGFNEFCAPSLDEALNQAVVKGADEVVVVTTMLTRGGSHSEADVPEAIDRARVRHPRTKFVYPWPFDTGLIASFLAEHLRKY